MFYKLVSSFKDILFISLIFIGLTSFSVSSFLNEVEYLKLQTQLVVERRAELITQHINFLSTAAQAIQNALQKANLPSKEHLNESARLKQLKLYPKYNIFSLPAPEKKTPNLNLSGTLHVLATQEIHNPKLQAEMAATLAVDPIFKALVSKANTITWVYYISKQGFLYLVPKDTIESFQFNADQYQKPFWQQVIPEHNPSLKAIITNAYDDAAGKGKMVTISNPVIINGEFIGAVSIDVTTEDLNQLISINPAFKGSVLIDEHSQIVASEDFSLLGQPITIESLNTHGKCKKQANGWSFSTQIVEHELYLIHSVSHAELLMQAAKNSLSLWALSLFGILLTFVTLRLSRASDINRKLMLIDPLTDLYNRRGFKKLTDPTIAHIKRTNQSWATLIIDLDLFKNVNDEYGHEIGDQVLTSVAKVLKSYNRDESIVCRWGGEEFLIFIPYATKKSVFEVAERIRQKVSDDLELEPYITITCSIGLAIKGEEDNIEITIKHSDIALYEAKEKGRNRSVFYEESKE